MAKKESETLSSEMLIADALLRLRAMENIFISKGLFTKEDLHKEMEVITRQIAKSILSKAGIPEEFDELMKSLQSSPIKENDN